jgi:hypothetical protein
MFMQESSTIGHLFPFSHKTLVGKIAETVATADTTKPPLVVRMEQFTRQISLV